MQGPKVENEYPITPIMQSQKMCTFFVKQIGHKVHMLQGRWQVANCLFSCKYKWLLTNSNASKFIFCNKYQKMWQAIWAILDHRWLFIPILAQAHCLT